MRDAGEPIEILLVEDNPADVRLTQEGLAARQSGVLLGSVLPIDMTGQPAQSRAFAPGKHHGPCVRLDSRILSSTC